jgi:type II secretory pathway pseudopilin PulG
MLFRKLSPKRTTGFALLETTAAVGLIGSFIAMLIVGGSNVLNLLRTSKDNVSANQAIQQRSEELRLANWPQVTDAQWLKTNVFSTSCLSTSGLSNAIETVTISPYPEKSGYTPVKVVRQNGVASVVSENAALFQEAVVRVDYSVTWKGFPKLRNRARSGSILIASGSTPE